MEKYRVITWNEDGSWNVTDHEAVEPIAEMMGLDPADVEWAIEEYGRCDTANHVAWLPSEDNGIEFPTAEAPVD